MESAQSWQRYKVEITDPAAKQLRKLAKKVGKRVFGQIAEAIRELEFDPEGRTQQLARELADYRSLHVNRCRVVVKIVERTVTVYVVAAGWHTSGDRDDVYAKLTAMLRRGGDGTGGKAGER